MKRLQQLTLLLVILLCVSCGVNDSKDYVLLTIQSNDTSFDRIKCRINRRKAHILRRDSNGIYTDTIRFIRSDEVALRLSSKKGRIILYVQSGDDIKLQINDPEFIDIRLPKKLIKKNQILLDARKELRQSKNSYEKLSVYQQNKANELMDQFLDEYYSKACKISRNEFYLNVVRWNLDYIAYRAILHPIEVKKQRILSAKVDLSKGQPAYMFEGYENYDGGTTSMKDLKGKYVYIDVASTNCSPCKYQIPYLQKVEKRYSEKNILFVTISVDSKESHDWWREMVAKREVPGIKLFANEDKFFRKAYEIQAIPRFILIDPQGKIVSADAPRPSNPELLTLLDSIL
ncbi:TlpA disulfide reductase family protein [Prolixibacteraceae bacterium]|nr:TlpA disulfide reductase family protein [Prolixibacteraceae bacterium]